MGWAVGYDVHWRRDVGYGVPAACDHPGCDEQIDRGLAYVCGGEPYGGDHGCGLFFCGKHLTLTARRPPRCARCLRCRQPFKATPDTIEWMRHKLTDESWRQWRDENPESVKAMESALLVVAVDPHATGTGKPTTREG